MSFLDQPTYAPLADGNYLATLVGFAEVAPADADKQPYLTVELSVHLDDGTHRPYSVSLFNKAIEYFFRSMQAVAPMNGATARELLNFVRDSGLVFDITIWHKDGYRNVDFFKRDLSTVTVEPATDALDVTDIPL